MYSMETSLSCQSFESGQRQSTQNQMQTYFSPSVLVFYQSVKIEKFLHFMYFSVCERETLLFFLMNLLTGLALALRSSQFQKSAHITANSLLSTKHVKNIVGSWKIPFRDETTENKQRLQKCPIRVSWFNKPDC